MHAPPPEIGRSVSRDWYLVRCKPRGERTALENLARQQYRVFLPLLRVRRRRRGKFVPRVEPMFPGYLFVELAQGEDDFAPIRSTLGVMGLVRFGDAYARLPGDFIRALRDRSDADGIHEVPQAPLARGQRVMLIEGAFAGYEAVFEAGTGRERVAVLLDIAGRFVRIQTGRAAIEPL
ncbi:MAG: transcription/translation regulatory transformer protein RfaH [Gammaproteobacteria bacterium]